MTPKFIIASIVGVGAIGGGVFGCYNCLRPQESEKSKTQETLGSVTDPKPDAPSESPQTNKALTKEPTAIEPAVSGKVSS